MTYIEAINAGWPDIHCYTNGDPNVYADIVFVSGSPIPTEAELDAYIANAVYQQQQTLTKYQFRKLYTFNERVAVDNVDTNPNISAQHRAIVRTIMNDLNTSGEVQMYNPDVLAGVTLMEQLGLIGPGRGAQIISMTPPPT